MLYRINCMKKDMPLKSAYLLASIFEDSSTWPNSPEMNRVLNETEELWVETDVTDPGFHKYAATCAFEAFTLEQKAKLRAEMWSTFLQATGQKHASHSFNSGCIIEKKTQRIIIEYVLF
jgi:uncharacterized membrane protein